MKGPLLLFIVWLGVFTAGYWYLLEFEFTPGSVAGVPQKWPTGSQLSQAQGTFDLVVFAHPRCPCTRATIGELAILMARCERRVKARVLFVKPAKAGAEWRETDLWRAAEVIPGVTVIWDDDGMEAKLFGAQTSGLVLLFDFE